MENKNICVTIPSNIAWEDYEKELKQVRDFKMVMNFRVPFLPKAEDRSSIKRCYLCYRGNVIGWMSVVGFVDEFDFECKSTGKHWNGKFIQRSGPFHSIVPIPMKGFRGFRYVDF